MSVLPLLRCSVPVVTFTVPLLLNAVLIVESALPLFLKVPRLLTTGEKIKIDCWFNHTLNIQFNWRILYF